MTATIKLDFELFGKREIEVDLPYYCWDKQCHYYKVYSETKAVQVYVSRLGSGIQITYSGLAFTDGEFEQIEESRYNQIESEIINLIKSK